ncbi:MAG: class I SAM-dependent methyltransferase [Bryobacteraceae bacterium]|nr:class I SAM-dependent methyltransferase [Bryobacteraceae bacterium]
MESHEGKFYDALAALYNQDWGTVYLETAREQFSEWLRPHLAAGAAVLDVCCGTGQMAAALTSEGYRVTGVDGSAGMIAHARKNAPAATFVVGEMSEFALAERFAAAICSFNSLNHARGARHLTRTLENIQRHLVPGGYFLGDFVLAQGYSSSWNRTATVDVAGGECQFVFRYEPRRQRAFCDATLRVEGEAQLQVRMRQHIFSLHEIHAACGSAGLRVLGLTPVPGDPPAGRVLLVAQRVI